MAQRQDLLEKLTKKQQGGKTAKRQSGKTARKPKPQAKPKKCTYYLAPGLVKRFKFTAIELERDLSDLAGEAIEDLVKKYKM